MFLSISAKNREYLATSMHPTCTSATNHQMTSLIIADNFTCKSDFTTMFGTSHVT